VAAPNQVVCRAGWSTANPTGNAFQPVGSNPVRSVGRPESSTPFVSVEITGYDHATGTLTVSPQAVGLRPSGAVHSSGRRWLSFATSADAPNTSTPTRSPDSGYQNVTCDYSGFDAGVEVGNILRVIMGTGRGQLRKITGNTAHPVVLGFCRWFSMKPRYGSWRDAAWSYIVDSSDVDNARLSTGDLSHRCPAPTSWTSRWLWPASR